MTKKYTLLQIITGRRYGDYITLYNQKISQYQEEVEKQVEELTAIIEEIWEEGCDKKRKYNNTCSHCGETNPIDKFANVNGEVDGSSYSIFGTGRGWVSGYTRTDSVNQCASCGHQWKDSNNGSTTKIINHQIWKLVRSRDGSDSIFNGYYRQSVLKLIEEKGNKYKIWSEEFIKNDYNEDKYQNPLEDIYEKAETEARKEIYN